MLVLVLFRLHTKTVTIFISQFVRIAGLFKWKRLRLIIFIINLYAGPDQRMPYRHFRHFKVYIHLGSENRLITVVLYILYHICCATDLYDVNIIINRIKTGRFG